MAKGESPRPSASVESQSGDDNNAVVAHSASLQSLDHGSGRVRDALPAFTPSATQPAPIAAATDTRNSHLSHQHQISARDDVRSANAPSDLRAGPVVTASKSSTAPASRSPEVATTKDSPNAHMSGARGRTSRVLVSSAKPQPLDHWSGAVTAASPDTAPPGELPATRIVH